MKLRIMCISFIITLLLVAVSGCSMNENNEESSQPKREAPGEIEKIEEIALKIMQQADLIPLTKAATEQPNEESQSEETITFEETILGEVIQKEMNNSGEENQELPENTEEIWDSIKESITELYQQWDELEPQLTRENISPDIIKSFDETMDNLTVSGTEENHFSTMVSANQLTEYLSRIMAPFEQNLVPAAYHFKYHTRNVLLAGAANNYLEAQNSLAYMEELKQKISKELDNQGEGETAEKLDISLTNLQRVVDKQSLDLMKINASILMENIIEAIQDLEQQ